MQREKQQLLCPFSPLVLHGTAGSRATERERDGGREGWVGGNVNEGEKRQHKKKSNYFDEGKWGEEEGWGGRLDEMIFISGGERIKMSKRREASRFSEVCERERT